MRLRYYPDSNPGISRRRRGRGFSYLLPDGTCIDSPDKRREIEGIAVPPAYEDVWITPLPNGHLLASGRDVKWRKQYVYHPDWRAQQEAEKYTRLATLGRGLTRLRGWIGRNLRGEAGRHDTAVAAGLALVDRLSMRVGDPCYTEENGSFGVTTVTPDHLRRVNGTLRMQYIAKGGRSVDKPVSGPVLERTLSRLAGLGAHTLLSWRDGKGILHEVRAAELNDRIADLCGDGISARLLRTWNGTHAAFMAAHSVERPSIRLMAETAADRLHNTPAIARNSYIHPKVIEAGLEGRLPDPRREPSRQGLRRGEAALLDFLDEAGADG